MKIEQIYTGCLAQGTYYIESEGEAAIIDPLREIKPYIEKAKKNKAIIKYVLETHFHADFVSGHIDLAQATGATIVYGPQANPSFDAYIAKDGEELKVGKIVLKVLHTPGHTMESTCYLLRDENGKDTAIFTGDTLFIGDVGRPDLAQKKDLSTEDLAGYLYDSLRTKIIPLSDDIIVYPAHGAGSSCGKNMSRETSDTLGHQKQTNYALRHTTKNEFIREVTDGLAPPPVYFPQNVRMNKEGYDNIADVIKRGCQPLTPDAFEALANETNALVLDTRDPQEFSKGFIPNSINIGINGTFAPWVGALIPDVAQQILIVAEPGKETEVVTRLARVGYDHAIGYLSGGFEAWKKSSRETDTITNVTADELSQKMQGLLPNTVLDVRKNSEYSDGHIDGAENVPLDYINENFTQLQKNKTYYVHCGSGYRSIVFISILKARGYDNLVNVTDGFNAIKVSGLFKISTSVPSAY